MQCSVRVAASSAPTTIREALMAMVDDRSKGVRKTIQDINDTLGITIGRDKLFDHRENRCDCLEVENNVVGKSVFDIANKGTGSPDPIRPNRFQAPRGWEPGITRFQADGVTPAEITTAAGPVADTEADWMDRVKDMGILLPEGYTVRLLQANYDGAAWTRSEEGADAVTKAIWRYKFAVVPLPSVDLAKADDDLLELIRKQKPIARKSDIVDGKAFVVAYADLQIGKRDDLGGSEETKERIVASTYAALARLDELLAAGRAINSIYITLMGDCVEGFSSQNGRLAFRQDLAPTEQIRVFRRLLTWIVKEFAKYGIRVVVATIPGNHDDAQRAIATYHDDDFATETASAVEEILAENPEAYGHVSFIYPQHDRSTITLNMEGTVVGLAHGHQTKGGAEKWWANMAHGCQPIGEATVLITAHFHHLRVVHSGRKTWFQCPTLDNGSRWYTETSGSESAPGLLTLLVGSGRWDDLKVV
jgi:predicted phosphodiesterase